MVKEVIVSGKLETADVRAFMFFHNYGQIGGALTGLFGIISLIACPIFILMGDLTTGLILSIIAVLYGVITPLDLLSKSSRQIRLNPVFKNKMTYKFEHDVLKVQLYTGASEVNWKEVYRIKRLKNQFLIYLEKKQALIVPLRYFACEDDVDIVHEFFEAHHLYAPKNRRLDVEDEQEGL